MSGAHPHGTLPMTVLSVSHLTLYRYRQPVSFGEHRSDTAALLMTRRPASSESATSDARYHAAPRDLQMSWG
jgi:hypothetical protein